MSCLFNTSDRADTKSLRSDGAAELSECVPDEKPLCFKIAAVEKLNNNRNCSILTYTPVMSVCIKLCRKRREVNNQTIMWSTVL